MKLEKFTIYIKYAYHVRTVKLYTEGINLEMNTTGITLP
jgi:hypothetical protein